MTTVGSCKCTLGSYSFEIVSSCTIIVFQLSTRFIILAYCNTEEGTNW